MDENFVGFFGEAGHPVIIFMKGGLRFSGKVDSDDGDKIVLDWKDPVSTRRHFLQINKAEIAAFAWESGEL